MLVSRLVPEQHAKLMLDVFVCNRGVAIVLGQGLHLMCCQVNCTARSMQPQPPRRPARGSISPYRARSDRSPMADDEKQ